MNNKTALHLLTEFAPVVAFFIAGQIYSFEVATIVLIASTICALVAGIIIDRHLPTLPLVSTAFVVISGSITVITDDPDVLIITDSLYYFMLAGILTGGLLLRFNLLKYIFKSTFAMTDKGWNILAWRWVAIFVLAGIANEYVRAILTPEEWIDFRFIKILSISLFAAYQFTLSRRYRIPEESNRWGLRIISPTTKPSSNSAQATLEPEKITEVTN